MLGFLPGPSLSLSPSDGGGGRFILGVKNYENLLQKIARAYVAGNVSEELLYKASTLYVKAKTKARDSRDKWKMKKRLGR